MRLASINILAIFSFLLIMSCQENCDRDIDGLYDNSATGMTLNFKPNATIYIHLGSAFVIDKCFYDGCDPYTVSCNTQTFLEGTTMVYNHDAGTVTIGNATFFRRN